MALWYGIYGFSIGIADGPADPVTVEPIILNSLQTYVPHPLSGVCMQLCCCFGLIMENVTTVRSPSIPSSSGEGPHQSKKYNFPGRCFGSKGELWLFKANWVDNWAWLDYQEVGDSVLCYYCSLANRRNLLAKRLYIKWVESFITKGFVSLEASRIFNTHRWVGFYVQKYV